MFLGHFAVGFAAKRLAPRSSLGVLVAAPLLLDLLWPFFLMLGWEEVRIDPGNTAFTPLDFVSYPISHSLLTSIGWAVLAAALYGWITRYRRGALVVAALVASHWVLDAVSHRPDLPLVPGGSARIGLGLWNSVPGTVAVEVGLLPGGLGLYLGATRAKDRWGSLGLVSFVGVLVLIFAGAVRGTPPPGVGALTAVAALAWLFPPWAHGFDRHREARSGSRPQPFSPARRK